MCGIAGIIRKHTLIQPDEINRMCNAMAHRGPDGEGTFIYEQLALGHRRLSIIDLEGGGQPIFTADRKYGIVFNGEIYNYKEIRQQLEQKGHSFHTQSDTEVLLLAYREWGTNCLPLLRGMFAFAIADFERKEMLLARDPFGIKPLFIYQDEQCMAFASSLASLKVINGFNGSVNLEAIDQFLGFKYISAPATAYTHIEKLKPAHYRIYNFEGQLKQEQSYWKFQFQMNTSIKTEEEWIEEGEAVLKESVKAHLVADVPFGAFLSGGIDSSLVVSYMAGLMNRPVRTFTIGFKEAAFDERNYANQVARRWQTDHTEQEVDMDAMALLPEMVRHYGEPFGDVSAMPMWYLSRLARSSVPMVLSGDAGDELFAGYDEYTSRWSKYVSPVPHHLSDWKKFIYHVAHKFLPDKFPYRKNDFESWYGMSNASLSFLWRDEIKNSLKNQQKETLRECFEETMALSHFQKAQYMDFYHYLPDDVLFKADVATMSCGLEMRTPLLDLSVVAWASKLPTTLTIPKKGNSFQGKYILKKILSKYFPTDFIYRPKKGFTVPMDTWMDPTTTDGKNVRERLLDSRAAIQQYIDPVKIDQVLSMSRKEQTWKLLVLEEWLNQKGSVNY